MKKIRTEYITNPDFDPAKVANASSAAEGLCKWIMAMELYDRVAKVVAPKKQRLAEAEAELAETMALLEKKRSELQAVEQRLATLKQQFKEMTEKKENLEFQVLFALFYKDFCSNIFCNNESTEVNKIKVKNCLA